MLQLLSELLLAPNNLRLMLRYVSDPQSLMQMMNLLKDSSRSIQYEAFHVFKVGACGEALVTKCVLCTQ
jgi:calcium binding protein 39